MLLYTKKGFLLHPDEKNNCFSFSKLIGFNYFKQIAKLVFFPFFPSLPYFPFPSCTNLGRYLPFFSSFGLRFIFYLITPRSRTSLPLVLLFMTGEGVPGEYLDRDLEACCLSLILSVEWGVRRMGASLCMLFNIIEFMIIKIITMGRGW